MSRKSATASVSRPLATFGSVYGVDFSGARQAGRTIWVARCAPQAGPSRPPLRLEQLDRLDRLVGSEQRDEVLPWLVDHMVGTDNTVWGIDFPFGLPVELESGGFDQQRRRFAAWPDGAAEFGRACLRQARGQGGPQHKRRATDLEQRVPFDPYHYRIIYQTFHGVRDVLGPLSRDTETCLLPFQPKRLPYARRVVVEACPCTTLDFLDLPTQMYKQPAGGPLTSKRRRNRRAILDGIGSLVEISDSHRLVMMRDPGADALDAVIAAAGLARAWDSTDHGAVARHPRYRFEGRIYA